MGQTPTEPGIYRGLPFEGYRDIPAINASASRPVVPSPHETGGGGELPIGTEQPDAAAPILTHEGTNMSSLYKLNEEIAALEEELLEAGGELTESLTERFDAIGGSLAEKVDGYAALIRTAESRAKQRREEADRLTSLARADESLAKRLKDALKSVFEDRQLGRMETPRFRVSLAKNGGKLPVHVTAEPAQLPTELQRVEIKADLDAIRERLEAGQPVEGAQLGERGQHLRIK